MTFRTFRPAGMIIERSWDYGRHWNVYRYFAADCKQTFPDIPDGPQVDVDDIICTEDFSSVEPSSDGEVWKYAACTDETLVCLVRCCVWTKSSLTRLHHHSFQYDL